MGARRESVFHIPGEVVQEAGRRESVLSPLIQDWPQNGGYFTAPIAPKRHWSSFQEHADRTFGGTDSALATPMIDDRREGFNWDTAVSATDQPTQTPSARDFMIRRNNGRRDSINIYGANSNSSFPSSMAMRTMSTASTIDTSILRSDTGLTGMSSISSGQERPRRAVPDIRLSGMSSSDEPTPGEPVIPRPQIRPSRSLSLKLSSAMKKEKPDKRPQKRAQFTEDTTAPAESSKQTSATSRQGRLKDRRKLERTDSLKLTLPLELPNLPPRGRSPVPKVMDTPSLAPPRKRSPKTPWVRDMAFGPDDDEEPPVASELKATEQVAALPPSLLSPRLHSQANLARSRRARNTTGTSDSATAKTESTDPHVQEMVQRMTAAQQERETKRSRLWLWIGEPRTSSPHRKQSHDSGLSSLWQHIRDSVKRHYNKSSHASRSRPATLPPSMPSFQTGIGARNESISKKDQIANLPMPPPRFTPPGLNRVMTPPVCLGPDCDEYDVKGKLEGFFFNVLDSEQPKRKGKPGGIWDSDALLMSQRGLITPSEATSEESPRDASPAAPTPITTEDISMLSPTSYMVVSPPPLSAHLDVPRSTMPGSRRTSVQVTSNAYFRVPHLSRESTTDELDEIERAKFEWLVPEHLASSPLCPLHPKYQGPISGMCLYHTGNERKEPLPAAVAARQLASVGA